MKLKSNQIKYWNKFYKEFEFKKPSNFAKFFFKKINNKKIKVADVGSGNGRDSYYFIKNYLKVISIDNSKKGILKCQNSKIGSFHYADFCKNEIQKKSFFKVNSFSYIYARFFIHAIDLNDEKIFFKNCKRLLQKNGKIFLEFRTIKDPLIKKGKKISQYERITSHYRRFINIDDFLKRIKKYNFKIEYIRQGYKFAIFKNDKPHICRLILKN